MTKQKEKKSGNKKLEARVLELEKELEFAIESRKKEKADFINERNRILERDKNLEVVYLKNFVEKFLSTLDSIYLALANSDNFDVEYKRGLELIYKQFEQSFNSLQIKILKPVGEVFDPNIHESAGYKEVSDSDLRDKIVSVVRLGLRTENLLIRAPIVYVGKYNKNK